MTQTVTVGRFLTLTSGPSKCWEPFHVRREASDGKPMTYTHTNLKREHISSVDIDAVHTWRMTVQALADEFDYLDPSTCVIEPFSRPD